MLEGEVVVETEDGEQVKFGSGKGPFMDGNETIFV